MSYKISRAGMESDQDATPCSGSPAFEPVKFAFCINSCLWHSGPYADLDECPKRGTSRLNESGRARRNFSYIPPIRRLHAFVLRLFGSSCHFTQRSWGTSDSILLTNWGLGLYCSGSHTMFGCAGAWAPCVTHIERSHARTLAHLQLKQPHIMPIFLNHLFPQGLARIIPYGRGVMARINAMPIYAWARLVIIVAGTEMLERARGFAVNWAARYVSFSTRFDVTDVL